MSEETTAGAGMPEACPDPPADWDVTVTDNSALANWTTLDFSDGPPLTADVIVNGETIAVTNLEYDCQTVSFDFTYDSVDYSISGTVSTNNMSGSITDANSGDDGNWSATAQTY